MVQGSVHVLSWAHWLFLAHASPELQQRDLKHESHDGLELE